MGIQYDGQERVFRLDTPGTAYLMGIAGEEGFLGHIYYGARLESAEGAAALLRCGENPFLPEKNERDRVAFYDTFPFEYPFHGVGDFRESCIRIRNDAGHTAGKFVYEKHRIFNGKDALEGLPATFGKRDGDSGSGSGCSGEGTESLVITCSDRESGIRLELCYSVFEDVDAVIRSVRVYNDSDTAVYLEKVFSGCLHLEDREYETITLHGSWARERHVERKRLGYGKYRVSSQRGESSHQEQPFLALAEKSADQQKGEVYGFHFIYSGNFLAQAQKDQFDQIRVVMGIEPEDFCWKLEPGDHFQTPEMAMVFSVNGLDGMSACFHTLYNRHLIRSPWLRRERPILINNWEATYFDFDEEKIYAIAKESAALGIEMLVLDDGWFGNRYDDNRALGDWFVNTRKLAGGLGELVKKINALGMKFGIWFEPEMVSPDSEFYRAHPDWAIAVPGRTPGKCRSQYVLDISRKEVRDAVLEQIFRVLHSANIEYVKWDMNRPLTDLGSAALPADRQGELFHRYVLGMYEMQERLLREFPELLLENCSGGGARFDPGMLYYSPQIWCSDDTDSIERLEIQEGTALVFPLSCMGAHVSVCPNHTVGRNTPFATRGMTALAGTFGYELDVTKLPEYEKQMIPKQCRMYHRFHGLIAEGIYSRIASCGEKKLFDCFQVTEAEKREALVFFTQVLGRPNMHSLQIRLRNLKPGAVYHIYEVDQEKEELLRDTGQRIGGSCAMQAGILMEQLWGDFQSKLLYLTEE